MDKTLNDAGEAVSKLADRIDAMAKRRRNDLEGYMSGGTFHPIRGTEGYSRNQAGESKTGRYSVSKSGSLRRK